MKKKHILSTPLFWFQLSGMYFAVLLGVIWFFNPNFLKITNCLVLIPLYIMLIVATKLKCKHIDNEKTIHLIATLLITGVTAVLILFSIIVGNVK